jgi:hypothetical protein
MVWAMVDEAKRKLAKRKLAKRLASILDAVIMWKLVCNWCYERANWL